MTNNGAARTGTITVTELSFTGTHTVSQFASPVQVVVPNSGITGLNNSVITVPVNVTTTTGLNITSFDFDISYDPSVLTTPVGFTAPMGALANGWGIFVNTPSPGLLRVSGSNPSALSGFGTLLNLTFTVNGNAPSCSPLSFVANPSSPFFFNAGNPAAMTTNGQACVVAGTISGVVSYGNAIGSPNPRYVQNVVLTAINGATTVTSTTNASGMYSLAIAGNGNYTVTPGKTKYTISSGAILRACLEIQERSTETVKLFLQ